MALFRVLSLGQPPASSFNTQTNSFPPQHTHPSPFPAPNATLTHHQTCLLHPPPPAPTHASFTLSAPDASRVRTASPLVMSDCLPALVASLQGHKQTGRKRRVRRRGGWDTDKLGGKGGCEGDKLGARRETTLSEHSVSRPSPEQRLNSWLLSFSHSRPVVLQHLQLILLTHKMHSNGSRPFN